MKNKNKKIDIEKTAEPEAVKECTPKKKSSGGVIALKLMIACVVLLALVWFGFTCTVREGNCAVILRFGAVRQEITEAGLYFKLPWPFETVVTYDNRLQYLESDNLETTTNDKRNIILKSYVVWEIEDPILYHNSVGVIGSVENYIKDQVFSATNSTLGGYNLNELVSLEKEQIKIGQIQHEIYERVREKCRDIYGINVADVSILRLSLPDANLESVFEQMRADRQKDIDIILNNAYLEANKITTQADSDAAEIESNGVTEAAAIRAKTEKEVAKIFADAQAANLDLFKYLTNLDTMVNSINSSTVLLVKADQYPFNILTEYSKNMTAEGDETVIRDLNYILTNPKLSAQDRTALINAIAELVEDASAKNGIEVK